MMKPCLLALTTLAFVTTGSTAQEAVAPWQQDDGSIIFEGKIYKSWQQLHQAFGHL